MAKITLATIKSFLRKNSGKVYLACLSEFDGMIDGVRPCEDKTFFLATTPERVDSYNLGINGAWFVGGSRDYFYLYEENGMKGYKVSNCCGSFILAVKNSV